MGEGKGEEEEKREVEKNKQLNKINKKNFRVSIADHYPGYLQMEGCPLFSSDFVSGVFIDP